MAIHAATNTDLKTFGDLVMRYEAVRTIFEVCVKDLSVWKMFVLLSDVTKPRQYKRMMMSALR
ncbi:hypothetical protein KIN20_006297 [Parelaphostrongylus tenuis]|uniref:Uncharacterized protein n=1 Tax=Parelaphostrongylus tenuis TaxID=148309 RepID=A0AAD5QI74_PARTN|nr:hypothetical protein KIN20_006297 [Parelaphostrongylus tenuis]